MYTAGSGRATPRFGTSACPSGTSAASAWDLQRRSPYAAALVPLGHAEVPNLGVARPEPAVYTFYRIDWAAYDSLRVRAMATTPAH